MLDTRCELWSTRGMTTQPTRRSDLVARIFALYADLGWSVPTSIEYARLTLLEDTYSVALNAAERRA